MDGKRFDDLTEALAAGASRRRVLKLLGGGLAGGLGLALGGRRAAGAQDGGNSACAHLCQELFPPGKARGQCIAAGAQGEGPCHEPVDPCAEVDCSAFDGDCVDPVCSGGTCGSVASNESGPCTAEAGAAGTCSSGACIPTDPCAGVDCSDFDSTCTIGVCSGGTCSAQAANETGTCTTGDNQAGTCTAGSCVANGGTCVPAFSPCPSGCGTGPCAGCCGGYCFNDDLGGC